MDLDEESVRRPSAINQMVKEDLSSFSLHELSERIHVLNKEIARVEQLIIDKKQSHLAAESFFKK